VIGDSGADPFLDEHLRSLQLDLHTISAGEAQAIESSTDPMIQLARSIDKEARAARRRYETKVIAVERTNYAKIAKALFEFIT